MSGDHVINGDWIGVIEEVFEEALIKVDKSSSSSTDSHLIRVCDLGGTFNVGQTPPEGYDQTNGRIGEIGESSNSRTDSNSTASIWSSVLNSITPPTINPYASNYQSTNGSKPDPSQIIDVRQTVVCVNWLGINQKLSPATQAFKPRPKRYFLGSDLSTLTLIRKSEEASHVVGDRVISKFRDERSILKRFNIQNSSLGGDEDEEVFIVVKTFTKVETLWQDGSRSWEPSRDLIPYLNLDEFDVWPGDFVLWNSPEDQEEENSSSASSSSKSRLGVVQSMDPEERTAQVRWYGTEEIVALPVLELDLNGHAIEPISFGIHRGDEVMISQTSNGLSLPNVGRIGDVEELDEDEVRDNLVRLGMKSAREGTNITQRYLPKRLGIPKDPEDEMDWPREEKEIDWVGLVLDVDLKGNIKIQLPGGTIVWETIDRLSLLMDGFEDDWSEEDDDEEEYESSDDEWQSDEDEETEKRHLEKAMAMFMNGFEKDKKDEWEEMEEDEDTIMKDPTDSNQQVQVPSPPSLPSELSTLKSSPDFPSFDPRWSSFEVLESVPSDHFYLGTTYTPPSKSFFSRLSKEFKVLKESLPNSILVRSFETRSDLLRVLIIGSEGTPYENAPFLIDFHLENYPFQPPKAYFHSWTSGNGRVSPNLYEDGKVCLSILGTWGGSSSESWNPSKSSLLQVFVSLQSLVLVAEPYYTEPNFEKLKLTQEGRINSRLYSEKAFVLARNFVRRSLEKGVDGLNKEIKFFYLGDKDVGYVGRLERVLKRSYELIEKSEKLKIKGKEIGDGDGNGEGEESKIEMEDRPIERLSSGGTIVLKRSLNALEKLWETSKQRE